MASLLRLSVVTVAEVRGPWARLVVAAAPLNWTTKSRACALRMPRCATVLSLSWTRLRKVALVVGRSDHRPPQARSERVRRWQQQRMSGHIRSMVRRMTRRAKALVDRRLLQGLRVVQVQTVSRMRSLLARTAKVAVLLCLLRVLVVQLPAREAARCLALALQVHRAPVDAHRRALPFLMSRRKCPS